jgi:low affinity Fe/Cu permease
MSEQKADLFTRFSNATAHASGHPITFAVAVLIILVWAFSGSMFKYSDTWQLVINTGTTIVTFLMVFLIQNTQNRDSTAFHLKLDELIRSIEGAHNNIMDAEEMKQEDLDKIKQEFTALAKHAKELRKS